MPKLEDSLNDIFDLPKSEVTVIKTEELIPVNDEPDVETDFESARRNIKNILKKGDQALDGILSLANASEHPRTFEVAGQIIKTLVDANKDLLGLHKQVKELRGTTQQDSGNLNVNNAVFVGSTAELQKYLKEKKNVG